MLRQVNLYSSAPFIDKYRPNINILMIILPPPHCWKLEAVLAEESRRAELPSFIGCLICCCCRGFASVVKFSCCQQFLFASGCIPACFLITKCSFFIPGMCWKDSLLIPLPHGFPQQPRGDSSLTHACNFFNIVFYQKCESKQWWLLIIRGLFVW